MAVTPGMAAERREGRMNGGVPFYSPPGRSWQQRGSTFDDRNFAVVGLDDDDIGFADIDEYQPRRVANG